MSQDNWIPDLMEDAEDKLMQRLVDRQEDTQGIAEAQALKPGVSEAELMRFGAELDKRAMPLTGQRERQRWNWRRAMVVAAIVIVLLVTAVSAFHREILNWVERTHEQFTLLQAEKQAENTILTWEGYHIPTAAPEAYFASDAVEGETAKIIEYSNAHNDRILFYQYTSNTYLTLDTEDVVHSSACRVGTITARCYEKNGKSTLYWFENDRAYSIEFNSAQLSLDAVEQMAESLSPIT